jgi:hypothetical protein
MTTYEIPLSGASQTFQTVLKGKTYTFTVIWRDFISQWLLDIADAQGRPILNGLPLVTGTDLLGQHEHLGLGFGLHVVSDVDPDAMPTYDNLGTGSHLYAVIP